MDVLTEILRVVKLESAFYFNAEFSAPWCLLSPPSAKMAPALAPGAEHVVIYHLLVEGSAYARLSGGPQVPLEPGDIVIFPHGDPHVLGYGEGAQPMDAKDLPPLQGGPLELVQAGGGGEAARFVCGFMACDPQLCQALLASLPRLVKVNIRDGESGQWLENSILFSVNEAAAARAGRETVLTKLSEVLFAETLRRYIASLPQEQTGWLAGARDPEVGRALALLHHQPEHPWTVAELAQQAGVSRSVLAERFRYLLHETPMAYLTRWRLQLGAQALTSSSRSVAEIAASVGYESEAAFNRAFKREYGEPPARYRSTARKAAAAPQRPPGPAAGAEASQ